MERFVDFRHITESWDVSEAPLIKAQYVSTLKKTRNVAWPLFRTYSLAMLGLLTIGVPTAFTEMLEYIDGMYKCDYTGDALFGFIFKDKVPEFIQIHIGRGPTSVTVKTFGKRVVILDTCIPFFASIYPRPMFSFGTSICKCYCINFLLTCDIRNDTMCQTRNYLWDSICVHYNAYASKLSVSRFMRPLKNIVQDLAQDMGIETNPLLMRRSNRDAKALAGPSDIVFEP